jgi:hypothetical protein
MDNELSADLIIAKQILYSKLNAELKTIKIEKESAAYSACTFEINKLSILYREAKITPTKIGLFVTIWKRNKLGITEPFNVEDNIDFVVVSCRNGEHFGQFIFPKAILGDKKIFTTNNIDGKRGIRVYPPWDITKNKQATQTQAWQLECFLDMKENVDLDRAKKLYAVK